MGNDNVKTRKLMRKTPHSILNSYLFYNSILTTLICLSLTGDKQIQISIFQIKPLTEMKIGKRTLEHIDATA